MYQFTDLVSVELVSGAGTSLQTCPFTDLVDWVAQGTTESGLQFG